MPERTATEPCTGPVGICYPSDVDYWQNQVVSRWARMTPQEFTAITTAGLLSRFEALKREKDALLGGWFTQLRGSSMVEKLIENLRKLDALARDAYAAARVQRPNVTWTPPTQTGGLAGGPQWWVFALAGGVLLAAIWAANR